RDRRVRAADDQAQMRALLAPPRGRGRARRASAALRALRVERGRAGRRAGVVLMARAKPDALPWLLASVIVIVLDQWSKAWVLSSLPEYTAVPVIDGFWNWYRTYNTGAAFSFLADAGGWQKWFFVALAFAISGRVAWMLSRAPRGDWKQALPLALVIGGALGNVIDRFLHGHVVDFIQWHVGTHYWPAFNIADCAVVGGASGIGLFGLLAGKPRKPPS